MILGVTAIITKVSIADEFGIYRRNDEGVQFLLFSCSRPGEARNYAKVLAGMLKVSWFDNIDPKIQDQVVTAPAQETTKQPPSTDSSPETYLNLVMERQPPTNLLEKPRHKKVMGVGPIYKEMLDAHKTDEEIIASVMPKYLATGRTEKEAKELILAYVSDLRRHGW